LPHVFDVFGHYFQFPMILKITRTYASRVMVFRQILSSDCSTSSESIIRPIISVHCPCTVSPSFSLYQRLYFHLLFTPFFGEAKYSSYYIRIILHGKKTVDVENKYSSFFITVCVSATCTVSKELWPFLGPEYISQRPRRSKIFM